MRALVAFDKFKDSLVSERACEIAAEAINAALPGCETDLCPLTDGGEGFARILTRAAGGTISACEATGPLGATVAASFGIVPLGKIRRGAAARLGLPQTETGGSLAIIEMASASGLALVPRGMRDPMRASSAGTGDLIRAAAAAGARAVLLGVGGSATHDLGLGALGALGVRFVGASGEALCGLVPADWGSIAGVDGRAWDEVPQILIACDVTNPLLGPNGALAVYGPQKGLRPEDAAWLEGQSARLAGMLCRHFGRPAAFESMPGAGAAGGIAFGLMAGAGATLLPGFDVVASWVDLEERLAAADLVLTGEGRFDESSMSGKGPGSIVQRALARGKQVHVFAGEVSLSREIPGLHTHAISPREMELSVALVRAPDLLRECVRRALCAR